MRRGMTKFAVTAAQSVITKNPSLLSTNLMTRASCQRILASGRHPLGFRWRSMTPQSGTSYAAGLANGFFFVTQPARFEVLYWYQSTPAVIGMIGTSRTIAASSLLTIACCFAELVVAAYCLISLSTFLL